MIKIAVSTGAVFAGLAVALGALGAHALQTKAHLSPEELEVWKTGTTYQMYHSLALIAVGILAKVSGETKFLKAAMWLFIVGILFFSGSLYLLSTRNITGIGTAVIGPVTPVGGLLFIAGWICLMVAVVRNKTTA